MKLDNVFYVYPDSSVMHFGVNRSIVSHKQCCAGVPLGIFFPS